VRACVRASEWVEWCALKGSGCVRVSAGESRGRGWVSAMGLASALSVRVEAVECAPGEAACGL
jgi:hypothetical protein